MKTCQRCDEPLQKRSKYCETCLAEIEREKERAREQKDRKTRKRD
jgi:predicted amidophosphoribosyltransferase